MQPNVGLNVYVVKILVPAENGTSSLVFYGFSLCAVTENRSFLYSKTVACFSAVYFYSCEANTTLTCL